MIFLYSMKMSKKTLKNIYKKEFYKSKQPSGLNLVYIKYMLNPVYIKY